MKGLVGCRKIKSPQVGTIRRTRMPLVHSFGFGFEGSVVWQGIALSPELIENPKP